MVKAVKIIPRSDVEGQSDTFNDKTYTSIIVNFDTTKATDDFTEGQTYGGITDTSSPPLPPDGSTYIGIDSTWSGGVNPFMTVMTLNGNNDSVLDRDVNLRRCTA